MALPTPFLNEWLTRIIPFQDQMHVMEQKLRVMSRCKRDASQFQGNLWDLSSKNVWECNGTNLVETEFSLA